MVYKLTLVVGLIGHNLPTYDMIPGFKPFAVLFVFHSQVSAKCCGVRPHLRLVFPGFPILKLPIT